MSATHSWFITPGLMSRARFGYTGSPCQSSPFEINAHSRLPVQFFRRSGTANNRDRARRTKNNHC